MSSYLLIKQAHILFALISISFFVIRSWWSWRESAALQQRWVRIAPHINDTLLLVCACVLILQSGQYPGQQHWLTAKVVALIVYILLGTMAIKRGKTANQRLLWSAAAVSVFAYMFGVALSKSPASWLALG